MIISLIASMLVFGLGIDNHLAGSGDFVQIHWQPGEAPVEKADTHFDNVKGIELLSNAQMTMNGHITATTYEELFAYKADGQFVLKIKMPLGQTFFCHTYDSDLKLYVAVLRNSGNVDGNLSNYYTFFHQDGSPVDQAQMQFKLNGEITYIQQIRHIQRDVYLLNVWSPSFNQPRPEPPKTLVLAKRVKREGVLQLEAMSEAFDFQSGEKRQLNDNFVDRFAWFSKDGMDALVVHEIIPEFQLYQRNGIGAEKGSQNNYFKQSSTSNFLQLENWVEDKMYPRALMRSATEEERNFEPNEFKDMWLYHFSKVTGLHDFNDGHLILGYQSPNPRHKFYQPANGSREIDPQIAPFTLHLNFLGVDATSDRLEVEVLPGGAELEGGILLGTHNSAILALKAKVVGKNKNGQYLYRYDLFRRDN